MALCNAGVLAAFWLPGSEFVVDDAIENVGTREEYLHVQQTRPS